MTTRIVLVGGLPQIECDPPPPATAFDHRRDREVRLARIGGDDEMAERIVESLHAVTDGSAGQSLDLAYDLTDELLLENRNDVVDSVIRRLEPSSMSALAIVGLLTITAQSREQLPSRAGFVTAAQARLLALMPEAEAVRNLRGLE